MLSINKIHKLADIFIKLSQIDNDFIESIIELLNNLGGNVEKKDILTWIESNKTAIGNWPSQNGWSQTSTGGGAIIHDISDRKYVYIAKNDSYLNRDKFEVKHSSILHPSGKIPKLFLIIGEYNDYETITDGRDIAHFMWLAEAIKRIDSCSLTDAIQETRYVLEHNSSALQKIRKLFSISSPKYIGGGSDGMVFDIGDGKILKIFQDRFSYEKAKAAQHSLHKEHKFGKTEAMIYDVGELKGSSNAFYFYYIMEKMTPVYSSVWLSDSIKMLLSIIALELHNGIVKFNITKEELENKKTKLELHKKIRKLTLNLKKYIRENHSKLIKTIELAANNITKLNPKWLDYYIEEVIIKFITGRGDLHMGNLGITEHGQLRYFDSAYSGWEGFINV